MLLKKKGKPMTAGNRPANFTTRGMVMEAIQTKPVNFWPFRRAVILLFNEKVIFRKEFIELWGSVYGKD
jgi:hypothetical protein